MGIAQFQSGGASETFCEYNLEMKGVSIEKVIETFASIGFDDTQGKLHCRKYLAELSKSHTPLPRENVTLVKADMITSMKTLRDAINHHAASEFMALPELFDNKYNHMFVLYWICIKEFLWAQSAQDKVPDWYQKMTRKMSWTSQCLQVLEDMLAVLEEP